MSSALIFLLRGGGTLFLNGLTFTKAHAYIILESCVFTLKVWNLLTKWKLEMILKQTMFYNILPNVLWVKLDIQYIGFH